MREYKWLRVTKGYHCRICGKPDFCTYAPEAGLILCMRIESDRPSKNSLGGWIHGSGDRPQRPIETPILKLHPKIAWDVYHERWRSQTSTTMIIKHAEELGLDPGALNRFAPAWNANKEAWIYPMRDEAMKMIGMRVRLPDGKKISVTGSATGLFLSDIPVQPTVVVCEGVTDSVAALQMGYYSVGRPSCSACAEMLLKFLGLHHVKNVIIIPDNDTPGLTGADSFVKRLKKIKWLMWIPPAKDLRRFLSMGGTREMMEEGIRSLTWNVAS